MNGTYGNLLSEASGTKGKRLPNAVPFKSVIPAIEMINLANGR